MSKRAIFTTAANFSLLLCLMSEMVVASRVGNMIAMAAAGFTVLAWSGAHYRWLWVDCKSQQSEIDWLRPALDDMKTRLKISESRGLDLEGHDLFKCRLHGDFWFKSLSVAKVDAGFCVVCGRRAIRRSLKDPS